MGKRKGNGKEGTSRKRVRGNASTRAASSRSSSRKAATNSQSSTHTNFPKSPPSIASWPGPGSPKSAARSLSTQRQCTRAPRGLTLIGSKAVSAALSLQAEPLGRSLCEWIPALPPASDWRPARSRPNRRPGNELLMAARSICSPHSVRSSKQAAVP